MRFDPFLMVYFSMGQLNKHKEGLQRERDKLLSEVTMLKEKLEEIQENQDVLQKQIEEATEKSTEAEKQMEVSAFKPVAVLLGNNLECG